MNKFSRFLTSFLPYGMSFTITLGVAPLLFVQVLYGQIFFSTSVLMGWVWLFVVAALMVAYYSIYYYQYHHETSGFARKWVPVIAFTLQISVALIFVMNFKLFFMADQWKEIARTSNGLFMNFGQAQVWPSMLHYLGGMIAFAGLLLYIHGWARKSADPEYSGWAARVGGLLFVVPTALQFLFGTLLLLALPKELIAAFMMGNQYATYLLFGGMILTLLVIVVMILAAVKRTYGLLAILGIALSVVILAVMTMVRAFVRDWIITNPEMVIDINAFEVSPQWFNMGLFGVLLVAGLATVGWMLYQVAIGKGEEDTKSA